MNTALAPRPMAVRPGRETSIGQPRPSAFRISVDQAGLDGIYAWNSTILVVPEVNAGTTMGFGYTCTDARSGGCAEFWQPATLCEPHHAPLSGHGAHAMHLPPPGTAARLPYLECFHDHVWIERMVLESAPVQHHGVIPANLPHVGHGLAFEAADARRFRVV
jgi:hypothetical protein